MTSTFALVLLLALATPALAQDRLDAVAAAIDRATATPAAEAAALERMAKALGVAPDVLRTERVATGLGWGDLFIAHRVSTRSGHPVEKVFAARRTKTPWGEIAEEGRVEPDALVQDVAGVWPEAARAPGGGDAARPGAPPPASSAAAPDDKKGFGDRVRDALRGGPTESTPPASGTAEKPTERSTEEIRDRMIRGGGSRTH